MIAYPEEYYKLWRILYGESIMVSYIMACIMAFLLWHTHYGTCIMVYPLLWHYIKFISQYSLWGIHNAASLTVHYYLCLDTPDLGHFNNFTAFDEAKIHGINF